MSVPTLRSSGLTLRALSRQDAPAVFAYASDPVVARWVAFDVHRTLNDTLRWFDVVASTDGSSMAWAIVADGEQRVVGTIGLVRISPEHERAEMGFSIAREFWGRGYTTAAAREVLRFAFRTLLMNRVEAFCRPENVASARVLEKCGMSYEGTLRQRKRIKGELWDLKVYSILRAEFEATPLYNQA